MELVGAAVIVLYTGLYGVTHSLLASDGAKALARRAFGAGADRWYRLAYNTLALVALAPVYLLISWFPDRELYALPSPWNYLVLFGKIASLAGVVYALFLTGIWDLSGLRQAGWAPNTSESSPSGLVTSGIYGWVRHPLYLFALGLFWLEPRMTVYSLAVCVVFSVYIYVGTFFEERRLVREFGAEYLEYRERTPRLLPIRWPRGRGWDRREAQVR